MTPEEIAAMQEENRTLKALVTQQALLIAQLQQQVQALQEREGKDSHNSHLPPSSDRFVRQPRSLRQKSEKKAGGQPGHQGTTLQWHACPDEVVVHAVTRCATCQ